MDADLSELLAYAAAFAVLVLAPVLVLVRRQQNRGPRAKAEASESHLNARVDESASARQAPPATSSSGGLRQGLGRTRKGFLARLNALLAGGGLDANHLEELETLLIGSDVGVKTTARILEQLQSELGRGTNLSAEEIRGQMKSILANEVDLPVPPLPFDKHPAVVMVVGVNGVGKTTTIGKLAAQWVGQGKRVVVAAGDTFRAAAAEQLEIWAERTGAVVVRGEPGRDPSAVIFEAIQKARALEADVCICDTAGRLHTKTNLMEELKKVQRAMGKAMEGAPHEVMMVLDATTGQNAVTQVRQFAQAVPLTSLVLTKLDGTAKGGIVVAICHEIGLPVRYVGVGERAEDLMEFDPQAFVNALFDDGEPKTSIRAQEA
jgi:fused signal recognition particle receptor